MSDSELLSILYVIYIICINSVLTFEIFAKICHVHDIFNVYIDWLKLELRIWRVQEKKI